MAVCVRVCVCVPVCVRVYQCVCVCACVSFVRGYITVGPNVMAFTSRPFRYAKHHRDSIYCNSLQLTARHCKTLQHIATHCNTLQRYSEINRADVHHCHGRSAYGVLLAARLDSMMLQPLPSDCCRLGQQQPLHLNDDCRGVTGCRGVTTVAGGPQEGGGGFEDGAVAAACFNHSNGQRSRRQNTSPMWTYVPTICAREPGFLSLPNTPPRKSGCLESSTL